MPIKSILQGLIWLVAMTPAVFTPAGLEPLWAKLEVGFRGLSRRRVLSCALMALTVLAGRGALLLVWDIPQPVIHDEFCYLLQGETFASGRLTNATHPMAEFFETAYVLQKPTYNAKYPPGQGLALAVGLIVFGNPWFGVWLSCGVLAAALCWALQGWFEPEWALAGAILALPFCTLTYAMNTYCGGAVAGIGGALVLGALPRIRANEAYSGAVFGLGATILAMTRPFEGAVALAPFAVAMLFQKSHRRQWAGFVVTAAAGAGFLCYYNFRVTGDPLQLPYSEYEAQYPMASHFTLLPPPPPVSYERAGIIMIDHWEREAWKHTLKPGFYWRRLREVGGHVSTFFGSMFVLLPLFFLADPWRAKLRAARWAVGLTIVVGFVETVYFTHYAAPALASLLVLVVAGLRALRQWRPPAGLWLARTIPVAAVLIALMDPAMKLVKGESMDHPGAGGRARIAQLLDAEAGQQVILVRHNYPSKFEPRWDDFPSIPETPSAVEFVRNGANIDEQRVVWAHDLGKESNRRLREYYKDRRFWLFDPAENPDGLTRIR
ncbi:MAG: hypothetical protein ACKV2U_32195, partial [Bryobacteraceae bacterium]